MPSWGRGITRRLEEARAKDPVNQYRDRYRAALETEGERADEAYERQRSFDPYDDLARASEAQFATFGRDWAEGVEDLMGQQVGMGRLRTGFGGEDIDRYTRDAYETFANEQAKMSWMAPQLELRNIEGMASARDRYGDILTGATDLELGLKYADVAKDQAKKSFWGTLAGGVLGALNPFG